jgi:hypothetical protein
MYENSIYDSEEDYKCNHKHCKSSIYLYMEKVFTFDVCDHQQISHLSIYFYLEEGFIFGVCDHQVGFTLNHMGSHGIAWNHMEFMLPF